MGAGARRRDVDLGDQLLRTMGRGRANLPMTYVPGPVSGVSFVDEAKVMSATQTASMAA